MTVGGKQWFSAAELAMLAMPGLPRSKRKINERAAAELWSQRHCPNGSPLARPRQARGGGLEYHVSLLPPATRVALARRGLAIVAEVTEAVPASASSLWSWFEAQSEKTRREAEGRVAIIGEIERLEAAGLTRSAAVGAQAQQAGVAGSTLWNWLSSIDGVAPTDRLPHLAPRRGGGGAEAEIDAGAWQFIISDYLRPERPSWTSCYRRLCDDYAASRGLAVPHCRTLWRKLEREIDGRLIVARRQGADALRRTLPPQKRSVAGLHALEFVNIDGHMADVFVGFPARPGQPERVQRPMIVAIQDVYSRKILAWRVGESESAVLARLAFADLFEGYGIPKACVLDNGRAFASKWITGGAKSRFRFKIRDEEPTGLLTALGIAIHWALPFRGQSKPIERGFRDFCDAIARHPAFAGAYTGNRPDAKPENHGSRAVPLEAFKAVLARGIAAHNARPGRRTEIAAGRSFDIAFADSFAIAPIGRATPEQLRLALLTADEVSTDRACGAISLYGNRYWAPELSTIAGKRVTARFDPDDLTLPIHVYDRAGRFLVSAPIIEATGFADAESAKARAKQEKRLRRAVRDADEMAGLLTAEQLARALPDHIDEARLPPPSVIRPVRHRGATAAALRAAPEASGSAFIDRFVEAERKLRLVE